MVRLGYSRRLSVESLVADSSKSGNYAVVAFGDAVVLVSGGGAVVDNIAVAVFGDVVVVVFGDVAVVATGADVGGSGDNIVVIFGNTVLRGNSNCSVSFTGDSTESINSGVVIRSAFEAVV